MITSPGYLWFFWPMLGWGIGVAAHAANTFWIGKEWEEKKIRELMDEDRRNTKSL
ncbi:MAG: 2TM domain-containing protein [Chryseobacterium taeanense]